MSDIKDSNVDERSDIILDGNTATWSLNLDGEIHGTYSGTFRFNCYLSPLKQIAANREYRELIGPNPTFASEHETFLAYALTQLKYRIVTAPPFWASQNQSAFAGDIADENVISAVLDAAISSEVKYRASLKKKRDAATQRAKSATENLMKEEKEGERVANEDEEFDDGDL